MNWRIHTGDSLRLLAQLPSNHVAAVITDPPYSSGGAMRADRVISATRKYTMGGTLTHRSDFAGDNRDQRAYGYWSALWLTEELRVTKPGGVCVLFSDWRQLPVTTDALQAGGWIWRGIVPWDKTESARPDKGRFRTQCEYVVWGSKGPLGVAPPDAPCLPGVIRARVHRSDKHHIAGKPTDVMRALVRIAWQGGIILDPFCGSGTTGVAAIEAGLDFIGCEVVAAYADLARARLAQATAQRTATAVLNHQTIHPTITTNPVTAARARNPTAPPTTPSDAGLCR
jgi:site-specific DNA-methyltransferase (adenine-specific)